MKDVIADHSRDWLTLFFAGLGVSFAPHEWIGGMFLALAGASLARHMEPEQDRRELWAVIVAAFMASHVAGMAAHAWVPAWPVQLPMMAAGFASRRATRIAMRVLGLIEARSDTIADRVIDRVLPPGPAVHPPPDQETPQ